MGDPTTTVAPRQRVRRTVSAVYENGVLRPLEQLDLPERQRVRITIDTQSPERAEETLRAWTSVYDGLSDEEIREVEAIALDRRRFIER